MMQSLACKSLANRSRCSNYKLGVGGGVDPGHAGGASSLAGTDASVFSVNLREKTGKDAFSRGVRGATGVSAAVEVSRGSRASPPPRQPQPLGHRCAASVPL